ncbi:hypothetical protein [Treponema endosymbiont of Eucomonympha sp.]|uniref:hypothetical protein n=1 Tax=Treponema endosymbiont of Eucomonympha sp. TaxID=1580831 RepID=UPI001396A511|nr:hypothetical protein [Treponema endosymbiont of Eucomonympha sp.]
MPEGDIAVLRISGYCGYRAGLVAGGFRARGCRADFAAVSTLSVCRADLPTGANPYAVIEEAAKRFLYETRKGTGIDVAFPAGLRYVYGRGTT